MARFNNLQVLRIIAAAAIVVMHLGSFSELCFKGVGLFFCLSGFVIMHSLRSSSPGRFLAARWLRIYPAYWLAVLLAIAARAAVGGIVPPIDRQFFYGLTLWPGSRPETFVLGVEWTLVFEVFYYTTLAALAYLGGRRLVVIAGSVWLIVCVTRLCLSPERAIEPFPGLHRIGMSAHNIPMLLGVMLYLCKDRGQQLRPFLLPLAAAGLLLSHTTLFGIAPTYLAESAAFAAIVWFAVLSPQANHDALLVRFGDWSYGLYLMHTTVIVVAYYLLLLNSRPLKDGFIYWVGALAILIGLAFGALEIRVYRLLVDQLLGSRARPAGITSAEPPARAA